MHKWALTGLFSGGKRGDIILGIRKNFWSATAKITGMGARNQTDRPHCSNDTFSRRWVEFIVQWNEIHCYFAHLVPK